MSSRLPAAPTVKEGVCPLTTRQIVDRSLVFAEKINQRRFYTYQRLFARRIVQALLRGEGGNITALFSRQSGKSEIVACISLGLCILLPALALAFPNDQRFRRYKEGFWVGVYAPTNKHSYIVYTRMRKRVDSQWFQEFIADPELAIGIVHSRGDSFAFSNGSSVRAETASENVLNEGETYHLIITDESQRLAERKINKELRPMLSSTNGLLVEIGTAFMSRCGFHADITRNVRVETETGVRNHYQFSYDQVIEDRRRMFEATGESEHLDYERWIQTEIARLGGKDSEEFKMNFELAWQDAFSNALDMTKFDLLGRKDLEAGVMALLGLPSGGRIIAGMDVAKDNDATFITIGHQDLQHPLLDLSASTTQFGKDGDTNEDPAIYYMLTAIAWLELRGNFEGDYGQYARVVSFLRSIPGLETLCIDATAMGDPVAERVSVLMPDVQVIPFKYTAQSRHHLYRWYLQEIGAKRFNYVSGAYTQETHEFKEFRKQHEHLVRGYNGPYLQCMSGSDEVHDDAPNSAALMCWASRSEGMPLVDLGKGVTNAKNVPFVEVTSASLSNSMLDRFSGVSTRAERYKRRY